MRDLVVTLIVLGSLPAILARPYIGILMWSWLAYMNPQRLTWGFAFDFPFSQVVAIVTLLSWLFSREPKSIPWNSITFLLILLAIWINFTTLFALVPADAYVKWDKTVKILLMTFVTLALIQNRERMDLLIWVIVLSIGFFSVKGGLFTLATGGNYRVVGPLHSFISDNNTLAAAIVMVLPLMRYLQLTAKKWWVRWGLWGAMGLSICSVLASYSRGAFVGLAMMAVFMAWRSRYRIALGFILIPILIGAVSFMPGHWEDRIQSIREYQYDPSVQGRFNAWHFAVNLANARPFVGGGFNVFSPAMFKQYAPDPEDWHNAHSIYFEALGEHGYVGFAIFAALLVTCYVEAGRLRRRCRKIPELTWARDLSAMLQASLIGYAVAGAFLNIAFYDLYYHLAALIALLKFIVARNPIDSAADSAKRARGIRLRPQQVPATGAYGRLSPTSMGRTPSE